MLRAQKAAFWLVLAVPLLALVPLGRVLADWVEVSAVLPASSVRVTSRGYDWVRWADAEGGVRAAYVFPRGPAAQAGVREGDVFLSLEGGMIFGADELARSIAVLPPGATVTYELVRAGEIVSVPVRLARYPTFLYPFSRELWAFSLWGFVVGAFLHGLGIVIALPLARTSARARLSLGLIGMSTLWIAANLARLLLVEFFGPPPDPGAGFDALFQTLTALGLTGWILFPTFLLGNVLALGFGTTGALRATLAVRALPAALLGVLALITTVRGSAGPLTLDGLVVPILFYAGLYIALAAGLPLLLRPRAAHLPGGFSRAGTILTLGAALLAAASVLGVVPRSQDVSSGSVGWLVVSAQLLSVAPVVLVALAVLRYGKVGEVLTRALVVLLSGGAFFFAFVGGTYALGPVIERSRVSWVVIAGLFGTLLFLGFERLVRRLRERPPAWFATERGRARARVAAFQETMHAILDPDGLAAETIRVAAQSVGARSAVLYFRLPGTEEWRTARYQPEPPYLTEAVVELIWPHLRAAGKIWSRRAETREFLLPPDEARRLDALGADVAVPIVGESAPVGMLVLAAKRERRSVYNLDDLDLLRVLGAGFALATERLGLIEREKVLARGQAEAQLVALRAQINPHFLFNALNTIASFIDEQPGEAERAVEHLSAIFRHTLATASAPTVTLADELDLVGHYLAIESMRFGDRLGITIEIEDGTAALPVPAFALQTLVENAIKHGLEPQRGAGRLHISARMGANTLTLAVADTGVGIPALFGMSPSGEQPFDELQPSERHPGEPQAGEPQEPHFYGIGLANVADRLAGSYGPAATLHLTSHPDEGTRAELRLPLAPPEAPVGDAAVENGAGDGALGIDASGDANGAPSDVYSGPDARPSAL